MLLSGVACCGARRPVESELFEYGRWEELGEAVRSSGRTNAFLEGIILSRKGEREAAAERFLSCTNDPWLREYALLRAGEVLGTNGLPWLRRAAKSTNFYVAYWASVGLAGTHEAAGRRREALEAWRSAETALRKVPAGIPVMSVLGPYHETRVRVSMMRLLREEGDGGWQGLAGRVLAQSRASRWHPWTPLVIGMVTNEPLRGWTNLFHTARHLMALGHRGDRVVRLAEEALKEASTAPQLFQSYEQVYGLLLGTNLGRLEVRAGLVTNLRGTRFEDGLVYYDALRLHNDRRTKEARRRFWAVLTNRVANAEMEARAVSFLLERAETYLPEGWGPLFAVCTPRLAETAMATVWFQWALKGPMAKRRWAEALAVLTNLPWTAETGYFAAVCRWETKDAAAALEGFRGVVRANRSPYYTVRALERIRAIHGRDHRRAKEDRDRAKALMRNWSPQRWPDSAASAVLLEALSWDPAFRLEREAAERLFALVPAGQTNRQGLRRILYFYERLLLQEGLVELLLNEPSSPVLLGELADRFREWRMPYPQIWCAERRFRAVSGGIPAFVFRHPMAAAAYPRWYEDEVKRWKPGKDETALGLALMREESRFRWDAVSVAGASGLAQLMPFTYRRVLAGTSGGGDLPEIIRPDANIEAGMRFLRDQLRRFRSVPRALAAYNAGPAAVERWLASFGKDIDDDLFTELVPFEETRRYIKRIVVSRECYKVFAD